MQEQEIADRIHAAFDIAPPEGGLERLRAALSTRPAAPARGRSQVPTAGWMPAIAALIAVAVMAAAVGYAVYSRVSTSARPAAPTAALPVYAVWPFSAQDIAVEVASTIIDPHQPRAVLITHDGGRTWNRTPLEPIVKVNLRWIDSEHIVAATDDTGPPEQTYSTSDGGRSWRKTVMDGPGQPGSMFFLDANEGWELCTSVVNCGPNANGLYHTTDAGAHWVQISGAIGSTSVIPEGMVFVSSGHGFIATAASGTTAPLLTTVDGGKTWRAIDLQVPAAAERRVDVPAIFGDSGVVAVVTQEGLFYTAATRDGGESWDAPRKAPFAVRTPHPSLVALDPSEWWVLGGATSLYRTTDAGESWTQISPRLPKGTFLDSIAPVGGGVLWGTAHSDGYEYPVMSKDGGEVWSVVRLPTS